MTLTVCDAMRHDDINKCNEARGPTNLHFSRSFFLTKNIFDFKKRSSLAETTKVFKIFGAEGLGPWG